MYLNNLNPNCIPPSENAESDLTKNLITTSQSLSHVLEQSQNQMQGLSEINESNLTKNHIITCQLFSKDPTTIPRIQDTVPSTSSHISDICILLFLMTIVQSLTTATETQRSILHLRILPVIQVTLKKRTKY